MINITIKQRLARPILRALSSIAGNRPCQTLLTHGIAVAQFLQGIGSGSDVGSSGETSVLSAMELDSGQAACIFDVGANLGQFLDLILSRVKSRPLHVHSFEPGHATFQRLQERFRDRPEVTLNNCALAKEPGYRELFSDFAGSGLASLTRRRLTHFGIEMASSE